MLRNARSSNANSARHMTTEWNFRVLIFAFHSSSSRTDSTLSSAGGKFQSFEITISIFKQPSTPFPSPADDGLIFHSYQSLNRRIDSSDIEFQDRIIFGTGTNLTGGHSHSRYRFAEMRINDFYRRRRSNFITISFYV